MTRPLLDIYLTISTTSPVEQTEIRESGRAPAQVLNLSRPISFTTMPSGRLIRFHGNI